MNEAVSRATATPPDNAPQDIVLAGKKWQIPMLSARQNRLIDPLILGLLPVFAAWQEDKERALTMINQQQYDALLDIAFYSLSRSHPQVTRDAFMDLPITLPELVAAFAVIAGQTGIFARGRPGEP